MKTSAIAAVLLIACTASAQRVPDMKPGDTCEKLRATYGKESSQEGPAHVWQQDAVTIRVLVKPGGPCVAGLVEYSIQPGHTFRTHDGIILGRDTIAEARLKLKGRIDANSYMSLRGEGKAYGQLEVAAIAGYPFKVTYSWLLNPSVADKLSAPPKLSDFTNEPVIVYSIDSANSQ
ncbi:MAG: hypothetical protein ABR889_07735 [Acidobacteriaceae bacterium]|jgi:hypothetical protein